MIWLATALDVVTAARTAALVVRHPVAILRMLPKLRLISIERACRGSRYMNDIVHEIAAAAVVVVAVIYVWLSWEWMSAAIYRMF